MLNDQPDNVLIIPAGTQMKARGTDAAGFVVHHQAGF